MAPTGKPRGRPRKSNSSTASSARTSDPLGAFPAPPVLPGSFVDSAYGSQLQSQFTDSGEPSKHISESQRVLLKPTSPVEARTPIHKHASSTKEGSLRMTAAQKQALIDNLRLEVTERARRLRAQYAQSAASLRRRLEMRIHRVPAALRKLTMGEVIERHEQKIKAEVEAKARRAKEAEEEDQRRAELEVQKVEAAKKKNAPPPAKQTRAAKRSSDELDTTTFDKENSAQPPIPNKRARPAPAARAPSAAKPTTKSNTTARRAPPSAATHPPAREVLSPKSHNSRAYPASPFKSPSKPVISRPTSPLKPSVQVSPSKPVTIPANVPAVANVGTASSMAKTKSTTATASKTGTVRGPPAGSTRAASRAGTATNTVRSTKPATTRQKATKTVVHVDDAETSMVTRQTRNSGGRTRNSGATDESTVSNGTTIVHRMPSKTTAATVKGSVRQKINAIQNKGTGTVGRGVKATKTEIPGGSIRGGRTLRKRA